MCVILLMLPFVGRAQQQKVSVRVNKAGVQEVFRQIKEQGVDQPNPELEKRE